MRSNRTKNTFGREINIIYSQICIYIPRYTHIGTSTWFCAAKIFSAKKVIFEFDRVTKVQPVLFQYIHIRNVYRDRKGEDVHEESLHYRGTENE